MSNLSNILKDIKSEEQIVKKQDMSSSEDVINENTSKEHDLLSEMEKIENSINKSSR